MIQSFTFNPYIRTLGTLDFRATRDEIRHTTMFFSSTPDFIRAHGDPLTCRILDAIERLPRFQDLLSQHQSYQPHQHLLVDTRVNMLMPGMFPSIPGWHGDDVPRSESTGYQPDPWSFSNSTTRHIMILLSDQPSLISATEFIPDPCTLSIDSQRVWASVNDALVLNPPARTSFVREGDFIEFNPFALHRASPASAAGWRLFFRLSFTHRLPANEIRNQVQVYISNPNMGW